MINVTITTSHVQKEDYHLNLELTVFKNTGLIENSQTDIQTNIHLAQLRIHEISEHIDHLAKYQGIVGLRDLRN